jgi:hypothetical protein
MADGSQPVDLEREQSSSWKRRQQILTGKAWQENPDDLDIIDERFYKSEDHPLKNIVIYGIPLNDQDD